MKNKFLTLSFSVLCLTQVEAAQHEKHGDVLVPHSPKPLHQSYGLSIKSNDEANKANYGSRDLNITSTDPYELEELHLDLFQQGRFEESSQALIASAIHGFEDNRAFLYEIDPDSLKHLRSPNPQSPEALTYYTKVLLPKVIEHAKSESLKLKAAEGKPVTLYTK